MIFILDLLLVLNVFVAYKSFRDFMSPPFLLGIGMLIAAIVATCYYSEWHMELMLPSSVLALGGGTLIYTFVALMMKGKDDAQKIISSFPNINVNRANKICLIIVFLSFIANIIKIRVFQTTFGSSLSFSELIFAARIDNWSGEKMLKLPKIVYWISNLSEFSLYLSLWFLSYIIILKRKNYKYLRYLTIAHLIIVVSSGLLTGAKGGVVGPILRFGIIYYCMFLSFYKAKMIKRTFLLKAILLFAVFVFSFKTFSTFLGRQTDDTNNTAMLAEYCGAEIKNFDIYMHGYDGNSQSKRFGEYTFVNFYRETLPNFKKDNGIFQSVGNFELGNVYTQFFQFHKDFGMLGVFVMSSLLSALSMFIYNRAKKRRKKINFFMLVYASIAFPIFMGFFSSQFTEMVFTPYYIKLLIFVGFFTFISNKYLIKGEFKYE